MWKQLTQRARKAMFFAQEEAERLGYNHVGPEHILLAIIREEDCAAARILERIGVDLGTLRVEVMKQLIKGKELLAELQLTPEAKQVIDFAFDEGRQRNDDLVGTEHLLIGLLKVPQGIASVAFSKLGIDLNDVCVHLASMRTGTLPFEWLDSKNAAHYSNA
ncbi:MAG: Clp protease N-terminal domain-containing protein [Armatimonadota bacterium]